VYFSFRQQRKLLCVIFGAVNECTDLPTYLLIYLLTYLLTYLLAHILLRDDFSIVHVTYCIACILQRVPVKRDRHQGVDWCADRSSLQERRRFAHKRAVVPTCNTDRRKQVMRGDKTNGILRRGEIPRKINVGNSSPPTVNLSSPTAFWSVSHTHHCYQQWSRTHC